MYFKEAIKSGTSLMNKFKKWEYEAVIDILENAEKYKDDPTTEFWDKYLQGRYISSQIIQEIILTSPYATEKALMTVIDINPIRENTKLLLMRENLSDKLIAYALDVCSKGAVAKWIMESDINNNVSDYIVRKCLRDVEKDPFLTIVPYQEWSIQFTQSMYRFQDYLKNGGENEKFNTAIYNNENCVEYVRDMAYDNGVVIENIKIPMTKKSEKSLIENSINLLYDTPTNEENQRAKIETVKTLSYLITNKLLSNDAQVLLYSAITKDKSLTTSTFAGNKIIHTLAKYGTDISTLINIYTNKFANKWLQETMVYENDNCPVQYKREKEEEICKLLNYYKEKGYQENHILQNEMYRTVEFMKYAINRCDDFPKLMYTLVKLDFKNPELQMIKNKSLPMKYLMQMQKSHHPEVEISAMFVSKYINKYSNQKYLDEFVKTVGDYISARINFVDLKKSLNKLFTKLNGDPFSKHNIERFDEILSEIEGEYVKKHPDDKPCLYELQDILKTIRNRIKYFDLKELHPKLLSNEQISFLQNGLIKEFTNQKLINIYKSYKQYEEKYNDLEKELERREKECQCHPDQIVIETQTR